MPTYSITGPDGKEYSIDGPEGATREQVISAIENQLALKNKPIETAGPVEAAIGSTKRMFSDIVTGAELPFGANEAVEKGVARQQAITEKPAGSLEAVKQTYEQRGFFPAAKEVITQSPGVIAEQIPLIGSMYAGAKAGAMLPVPPQVKPFTALAGSILLPLLSYAGSSAERKAEEQRARGENVDVGAAGAFVSGAGQAALDRLSFSLSGLSRVFGISAKELATEAGAKLAKESFATALAKGTLKTELAEIPTEIAQQAIERYYAGLPLTGEDALKEYGDIAYQTSLMGPLGGAGRVYERGEQRGIIKGQEQRQQQQLNRIDTERARIDQIALDAKLENINNERSRINKIAEDAKTEAEMLKAKEAADTLYQLTINQLGNKAPEKSKIAKSIAAMGISFDKAIEQGDIDAQKKAIAELTDVPTNIISLAQKYETKPTDVISDQTFKSLKVGPTAKVIGVLKGKDPLNLEDNQLIRNTWEQFLKNKEDDSPQSIAIRNYLNQIPTVEGLQNETTITEGSGEGVKVSGQPMAGDLTTGTEGVNGTGLGSATDNVQQLAGREGPRPAALAPESTEVLKPEKKLAPAMGIQAVLKKTGGINTEHLFDLTGEKSVNKSGATVGLFTKNGRGLDDAVQIAVQEGYLNADVLNEVDGGVEALSDLIIDEIQGKKAVPLDRQADTELEAYLAREEQRAAMGEETAPMRTLEAYPEGTTIEQAKAKPRETIGEFLARATPEELEAFRQKNRALDMSDEGRQIRAEEEANKKLAEATAEKKGRDILFGPPATDVGQVYYRGTDEEYDDVGGTGGVIYLSPNRNEAEQVGGSIVTPYRVKVKNTFDINNKTHFKKVLAELSNEKNAFFKGKSYKNSQREIFKQALEDNPNFNFAPYEIIEEFAPEIESAGFDSFFVKEQAGYATGAKNIAVFDASQLQPIQETEQGPAQQLGERNPIKEFKKLDIPENANEHIIPAGTELYHGAHGDRATEIEQSGSILKARPQVKSGAGMLYEGNLVWFGDKDLAKRHAASEVDTMAAAFDKQKGITRKPGKIFSFVNDSPLRLRNKNAKFTQEEAESLNKLFGLKYEGDIVKAGDDLGNLGWRAHNKSPQHNVGQESMSSVLSTALKHLGYDGLYDRTGIALNIGDVATKILPGPRQVLGERNPIFDKVTNAKELFKAVMKIADTRSDKAIINMLERVPNLETVKVITENTSTDPELQGASGYFDPNTNTIFIDPRVTDLSHITLHEIAHAATDVTFDKHVKIVNNVHTPITPLGKKMVKLFDAFMAESLKKQEGFYGQKNVKEFFMESYTDPKLKNFLQNRAGVLDLKPAQGKIATLWSDFVNLIKSMFGIPEYAHSMLSEILLLSPELMKGPGAITTGKEVSQARVTPEGMTRPDGTPLKYVEDTNEGIIQKFKNVFNDDTNQWRKWMDQLGNKIIGGRYSVERKALDADLPAVDAYREGKIRGDLINLQAYNSMSLAQAGLYLGRLLRRKSGLIIADESTGPDKVKMLDISKSWNELVDRASQDLGSKELAYDMLVAGYYGPRYAELARFNETASADEKINIDEWTESDKRTAAEAYRRYGAELKRLQDMRNVQRKDLLDFMVDTGLYTREKADRFLNRAEYVALYRVPEEEIDSFDRPTTKGAGLLGAGKEYRLVGSKRAAADPVDNYIANMSWMMQRGIKNNAAKSTADMMQQLGVGQWYDRPMTDVEKKAYHHITVHVDGLPKDFRVLDPNDMAAFSASPIISGAIWDIMKYPVSGLRHGITMMPQFVWNQAWEDPIRATFTSGNKAGFLNNITKTWKSIANNQFKADRTPNAAMLNRYGIIGQKDVLDSADVIKLYKGKDKKLWEKSLFFFERMAQGSDLGAREAIYDNAIKELEAEGYDRETAEDLAAVRSHQYMPYQQMGMSRSLAYLRRMMPFVNPPIQGMARDIAAARGRISGISKAEGKKLLAFRLAKYLMFTAMYAAFMSGDDDYENQSEDQQDNNFFIGGLRMPVPQELRALKVATERGTRAWVLNSPKADIEDMDVAAAALRKTWELIAGFAPIPSAVRPLAENYTNFDIFSGLPVVSAGQQRKEPYLQYTEKTSEISKIVGAQLNYSPIKIDKLLKGYFGYLGQTLGQVSNYFVGDRPAPTANDIIFVGSMLENQRATGNRGDFYDLYDKVVTAKASANALLQEGRVDEYRDYMNKNKGYVAIEKPINNLHNQLTKLRDYKRIIMASNRTAEEKREALDRLTESENNMLNNIKDLNRRAVEINKN